MDINQAVIALSALSQETRLNVFRLLIEYGEQGVAAGVIGKELGIPHNTLSFHLTHLSHAGLAMSQRKGRSIIYSANTKTIDGLLGYLIENCCVRDKSGACCPPKKKKK